VLFATLDTISDAQLSALETLYAGYRRLQGGGLRDGSFTASDNGVRLRLHRYALVPGLRISGVISAAGDRAHGALTVDAPGPYDGRLSLRQDGTVTGELGGRRVRFDLRAAAIPAATRTGRGARALLAGTALRAAVRGAALRTSAR
jgi:hypothetical protein